jgi:hypothetical protein
LGEPPVTLLNTAVAGDSERGGGDKNVSESGDEDRVACSEVTALSLSVAESVARRARSLVLLVVPPPEITIAELLVATDGGGDISKDSGGSFALDENESGGSDVALTAAMVGGGEALGSQMVAGSIDIGKATDGGGEEKDGIWSPALPAEETRGTAAEVLDVAAANDFVAIDGGGEAKPTTEAALAADGDVEEVPDNTRVKT